MAESTNTSRGGMMRLFRNGNFSLLWSSTLASQLGDHLNLMALTALIFSLSSGAIKGLEFSKILLLASAPVLIFGPVAGAYADRVSRKKMMIISDLTRAVLVACIPLVSGSMLPVYGVVFIIFTINRFYLAAKTAAIPQIVQSDQLMAANSLLNVAMMATIMLGPWGGGILVSRFGFTAGFMADAATYLLSAILAMFITLKSVEALREERQIAEAEAAAAAAAEDAPGAGAGHEGGPRVRALGKTAREALKAHSAGELADGAAKLGREVVADVEEEVEVIGSAYQRLMADLRDGLSRMRGNRIVVYSTVSFSAIMLVAGFVLIALPVLVRNEFNLGAADVGMLYSVGGIGMLVGSLIVGKFFEKTPRRAIITMSFLTSGVVILVLSVMESIVAVGAWIFALGFLIAPTMVTCDTILQENMAAGDVGKAFGFREMVSKAAFGVAGIASGIVVDIIGPRSLLVIMGVATIGYSALSLVILADTAKLNLLNAYPLMRAGSAIAASLPRKLSYWLASLLSGVAFIAMPDKRRTASENMSRVLGKSPESPEVRALARRVFRSYALYWSDFFGLNGRVRGKVLDLVRTEGLENLKAALGRGKGALLVTAHLGNWDMGGAALAEIGDLPDLSAIVEPVTQASSEERVTAMRERRGIKVIPLGQPMSIARALRRNEVVLLVGERLIDGDGVEVEFFGERTMFPKGAAYLSDRLGAPIVPGFCIRQEDGTFITHIEKPIDPVGVDGGEFDVAVHTQRIARIIEGYIAKYPEQWCMLQPMWGTSGGGS